MRKLQTLALAAGIIVAVSSCQSVKVTAPAGKTVVLAADGEALPKVARRKEFFLIGGLVPINNHRTEEIIAANGLTKVKVDTRMNVLDWLVSGVTFNIICLRTTDVYGTK